MRALAKSVTVVSAALLAGGLAVSAPAMADSSVQTVTAQYDCGAYGVSTLTLRASSGNGTGSIAISTPSGLAPVDIPANSISASLALQQSTGGTVTFAGTANDAAAAGQPVTIGPLTAPVTSGEQVDSYIPAVGSTDTSLTLNVLGQTNTCKAVSLQSPGPITF
ncbi:hypothetical protein ACIHFE_32805 [Streptomyces sp. NPDC052396]|uniref:hypothetical protein n=1 Tax=Streptomyces sp. NPDC052396 TaxID=3365689 RepID=UPI0037D79E1E